MNRFYFLSVFFLLLLFPWNSATANLERPLFQFKTMLVVEKTNDRFRIERGFEKELELKFPKENASIFVKQFESKWPNHVGQAIGLRIYF